MRELMRSSLGRMQGFIGLLTHKTRISVQELVEKVTAFCGGRGQVSMEPEFREERPAQVEEDLAA